MGRVMIERPAPGASRDADIRTYPVKAGESVAAGDVVDVVGGSVAGNWLKKPNMTIRLFSYVNASLDGGAAIALDDVYSVAVYSSPALGGGTSVLSLKDGEIKEVRTRQFTPDANNYPVANQSISATKLTPSTWVTSYVLTKTNLLTSQIDTWDGTNISNGPPATISANPITSAKILKMSDTSFVSIYDRQGLKAKISTISGNVITPGTTEYSLPGSTNSGAISITRLADVGSNKRVCVCYRDGADGNKSKAVIVTINSSNVATWGTPITFDTSSSFQTSCTTDGADVIVVYLDQSSSNLYVKVLPGATASASSRCLIGNGNFPAIVNTGKALIVAYAGAVAGEVAVVKRNGQNLTLSDTYVFLNSNVSNISIAACDSARLIATFAGASPTGYATATAFEIKGDKIAGSFENAASQAIALQSGAAGQSIDVIFDGTAELPGITAGTSITSPGVQGYSPQDGWVWVKPEWDGEISASYIGDNGINRTIEFGVYRKLLLIRKRNSEYQTTYTVFNLIEAGLVIGAGQTIKLPVDGSNYTMIMFDGYRLTLKSTGTYTAFFNANGITFDVILT